MVGLVGCFGFNGPLRQCFSLYRAVSQREGERGEKGYMRVKMSKQPPPAPSVSAVGPCPTVIQIVGRPGTGSLPSIIAPPDHPNVVGTWERIVIGSWCDVKPFPRSLCLWMFKNCLSAPYFLKRLLDLDQNCTGMLLGHGNAVIRFW